MTAEPDDLAQGLLNGDRRALARTITLLEAGGEPARGLIAQLFPHAGRAHIVGLTGAPGTGKSTLASALALAMRQHGSRVAILAIDPSSPCSGGALLGDRLRMQNLAGDPGIFVRSMATRGMSGGLARAAADAVIALDAAGFDRILVETVGAGQDEFDVAQLAHTIIVVEAPGLGDEVQAIKAGLLELADILVVNKADREGAAQALSALSLVAGVADGVAADTGSRPSGSTPEQVLSRGPSSVSQAGEIWRPPLLPTVATEGKGLADLLLAIEAHRQYLAYSTAGADRSHKRAAAQLRQALDDALSRRLREAPLATLVAQLIVRIQARELTPQDAAEQVLRAMALPPRT